MRSSPASVAIVAKQPVEPFTRPNCGARYKLVRVEAEPAGTDRQIVCRSCGAPLVGREAHFVLKYFLVGRPRRQAKRPGRGQLAETGTPEQR
jgi:hypothetical protein